MLSPLEWWLPLFQSWMFHQFHRFFGYIPYWVESSASRRWIQPDRVLPCFFRNGIPCKMCCLYFRSRCLYFTSLLYFTLLGMRVVHQADFWSNMKLSNIYIYTYQIFMYVRLFYTFGTHMYKWYIFSLYFIDTYYLWCIDVDILCKFTQIIYFMLHSMVFGLGQWLQYFRWRVVVGHRCSSGLHKDQPFRFGLSAWVLLMFRSGIWVYQKKMVICSSLPGRS